MQEKRFNPAVSVFIFVLLKVSSIHCLVACGHYICSKSYLLGQALSFTLFTSLGLLRFIEGVAFPNSIKI